MRASAPLLHFTRAAWHVDVRPCGRAPLCGLANCGLVASPGMCGVDSPCDRAYLWPLVSLVAALFLTPRRAPRRAQFYTDLLSEQLQDELEQQDQHSLLHFAWLMHKKTLVGVQRFEDLIHAKFEELVLLGFLKPRWQPHK